MKTRFLKRGWLMFATTGFASVAAYSQVPSALNAHKPVAPVSVLSSGSATTSNASATTPPAALTLKTRQATIGIKRLAVKPNEFPPIGPDQYKVAFECTIRGAPQQTDFNVFPRYRCDLEKARTVEINKLTIQRVDQFPSIDGITTKIVVIAKKITSSQPGPNQIHAAFQLYRDQSAESSSAMLKDFLIVDATL